MTPEEHAENFSRRAFVGMQTGLESGKNVEMYKLAARCIRACIEAAKEENWFKKTTFDPSTDDFDFENGWEFFQRALTGERT
jgi:hypothetical protein